MPVKPKECFSKATNILKSLNLIRSTFSMKANLLELEPTIINWWKSKSVYAQIRKTRKRGARFILLDGPPYANGPVHIGHAVNKILKDIIIKSKRLVGYDAPLELSWDCHGLPIEIQVERNCQGLVKPLQLLQAARSFASHQVNVQRNGFMKLGLMADWKSLCLTMDSVSESQELQTLAALIKDGLVRRTFSPAHWCPDCRSTLAGAEVEADQLPNIGAYVMFPFLRSRPNFQSTKIKLQLGGMMLSGGLCIWTTTPWTIMSNKAISINPNDIYVIALQHNKIIICSEKTMAQCVTKAQVDVVVMGAMRGRRLKVLRFQHPLYNLLRRFKKVPLNILDPMIRKAGTGLVHISPAHGAEDFELFKERTDYRFLNSVSRSGFHKSLLLRRKHFIATNLIIIAWLSFQKELVRCVPLADNAQTCWRHGSRTLYRMIEQWVIKLGTKDGAFQVRNTSLAYLKDVSFLPQSSKQFLMKALWNRPGWILSRQRAWGVPITVYLNNVNKSLHPFSYLVFSFVSAEIKSLGIEGWAMTQLHNFKRRLCAGYHKLSDTLDVWFDSGCAWLRLKRKRSLRFPADLYLEGPDQHRGWFYSSIVSSAMLNKTSPTKTFATHGFVVNSKGEKISKSKMNMEDNSILAGSAEVLRLWTSSVDCWREISMSNGTLKWAGENYRRMRNTIRFLLSNLGDFKVSRHSIPLNQIIGIDYYIIIITKSVRSKVVQYYNDYKLKDVVRTLTEYCSEELGKFYLDVIKNRLYTAAPSSSVRRSAQYALYYIVCFLLKASSPILSFTAEEAWHSLKPLSGSVLKECHQSFPIGSAKPSISWDKIRQAKGRGLKPSASLKTFSATSLNLDIALRMVAAPADFTIFGLLGRELKSIFLVSKQRTMCSCDYGGSLVEVKASQYFKCARCWQKLVAPCNYLKKPLCASCKTILQFKVRGRKFA